MPERVLLLAPMTGELRPLVHALSLHRSRLDDTTVYAGAAGGRRLLATQIGVGTERAGRVSEELVERWAPDHVVVVGVAGAVDPTVGVRSVVVPDLVVDEASGRRYRPAPYGEHPQSGTLLTAQGLHVGPEAAARLLARGITALDMETAAVAEVCERRHLPCSAIRGISDRADDGTIDEAVLELLRPDGSADLRAVARFLRRQPARIRLLLRLARDFRAAAAAAAETVVRACSQ